MTSELHACLDQMAQGRGATLKSSGLQVEVSIRGRNVEFELPRDAEAVDDLADLPCAFPSRAARGDIREKALYNIVQDMVEMGDGKRTPDSELQTRLARVLRADTSSRSILSAVMAKQYWFYPRSADPVPFLAPFHSDLPGAYDYRGRYKSFRGSLLLFLCFDGQGFDLKLAENVLDFMSNDDGLNPLDRELLRAAREIAQVGERGLMRSPRLLLDADDRQRKSSSRVRNRLRNGAFDQDAINLIRRDLQTVLTLRLPRHDKVSALVLALSLHLALYYYRIAFSLGEGLQAAANVLDGGIESASAVFDGQLLFRVGSGGDRPVSGADPCARSWWKLDEQHLLSLAANMTSANLLHNVTFAVLGAAAPPLPHPDQCARALAADSTALALAEFLAAATAARLMQISGQQPVAYDPGAGGFALRAASLDIYRGRVSALKQRGRDVVNTMAGGFGGNLRRSRGSVRFFELDEQVLFLLVKLILDGEGVQQMPLQKGFLPALRAYGLAPQDAREEELLAEALQRLGLLDRYSDAGEATYVRHVL